MKLVLASQGFTTPEIVKAVTKLASKPASDINVCVINESYVGIKPGHDHRWILDEVGNIASNFGGTLSFVNLRAYDISEIAERLRNADIIYIVGGAQIVLPTLFRETGFDKVLATLAETKVVMGTSAGATVLGKPIENKAFWQDQYGSTKAYLAAPFLGFVPFNILPHFGRADHAHRDEKRLRPILNDHPFPLYGLTDSQAVIINNDNIQFVGGQPIIFGNTN